MTVGDFVLLEVPVEPDCRCKHSSSGFRNEARIAFGTVLALVGNKAWVREQSSNIDHIAEISRLKVRRKGGAA